MRPRRECQALRDRGRSRYAAATKPFQLPMYLTNTGLSPSCARCSAVTGRLAARKSGSACTRAGKIVVQDGPAPDDDEIEARLEASRCIRAAHDPPGRAEAHVAALEVGEVGQQAAPPQALVLWLLEYVPQRHVEEVDAALAHQPLRHGSDLGELHAEAFG